MCLEVWLYSEGKKEESLKGFEQGVTHKELDFETINLNYLFPKYFLLLAWSV